MKTTGQVKVTVKAHLHVPSVPASVTVKVYHCVNGEGLFDSQTGFGTHSACQCKFEGDRDDSGNGDDTCIWT